MAMTANTTVVPERTIRPGEARTVEPVITRRAALIGAASLPALAFPASAAATASPMSELIERHRGAHAALDAAYAEWEALREQIDLPDARVVLGVDHYTGRPTRWAVSEKQIDEEVELHTRSPIVTEPAKAARVAWGERKKAELQDLNTRFNDLWASSGLASLDDQVTRLGDAEVDAWQALVTAKPSSTAEAGEWARYMLSLQPDPDDGKHRLTYWLEEFLTSMAEA